MILRSKSFSQTNACRNWQYRQGSRAKVEGSQGFYSPHLGAHEEIIFPFDTSLALLRGSSLFR